MNIVYLYVTVSSSSFCKYKNVCVCVCARTKYGDRNPEYIMYMYAKILLNQKNYIIKNKKMCIQEMKKHLQEREVI